MWGFTFNIYLEHTHNIFIYIYLKFKDLGQGG